MQLSAGAPSAEDWCAFALDRVADFWQCPEFAKMMLTGGSARSSDATTLKYVNQYHLLYDQTGYETDKNQNAYSYHT